MKITAIESRVIGYDVAEAWRRGHPPEGINTSWYEYSFDTFHTDEGIVGYTMQNANLRDGAGSRTSSTTCTPRRSSARTRSRARPSGTSCAGSIATPTTCRTASPARSTSRSGTSAARWRASRSPRCSGWPARSSRLRHRPHHRADAGAGLRGGAERKAEGYRGFKVQFWDGLDRDIPRFRAAREAVGHDYPLMQDAAGHVHFVEALAAGASSGSWTTCGSRSPFPTATFSSCGG